MKIKWKRLFNAFLTAIASGVGKWVIGLIITSFMVVLVVLPVVQSPKRAVPRMSETTSTPAREPTAAELPTAAPPVMAPPLAAPPVMSDSAAACVGLRSWQARHASDSLTSALQAALERLERRCGVVSDSVENIPR